MIGGGNWERALTFCECIKKESLLPAGLDRLHLHQIFGKIRAGYLREPKWLECTPGTLAINVAHL